STRAARCPKAPTRRRRPWRTCRLCRRGRPTRRLGGADHGERAGFAGAAVQRADSAAPTMETVPRPSNAPSRKAATLPSDRDGSKASPATGRGSTLGKVAEKRYLMTPGPTPAPPEVLAAIAQPVIHHRGPDY